MSCTPSKPATPDAAAPKQDAPASEANEVSQTSFDLPAVFDCVRESGGLLIATHRGGPAPGYPENAIETLQHAYDEGFRVMEIDVAESRDGSLFLMHDRSLGRTTTGGGAVADTDWSEISRLKLVDDDGKVTSFAPPRLSETLDWAVRTGAILELDRKPTTSYRNIIDAVREAGAEQNVLIITYNDDEALQVARLAPDLMMTAGIGSREHEAELLAGGVDETRLVAWTGTNRPNPGKWRGLGRSGIESAFGTLGRKGERLDDVYWQDGDPSEFVDLIDGGLTMLATDVPYRLKAAGGEIGEAMSTANRCLD
ncbi:glycerophosphodiester phosphodiesterase family protein [Henriciella litoralis]|uniref:glycerophosphodiester phosphodiesterase family protein n=1 Tax=Henriciella litoralis TaxID=568102 RepID=UPI000A026BFE|nr:glycerophosphodiester phosphodiesterase family protein [Henriciella litoralis]